MPQARCCMLQQGYYDQAGCIKRNCLNAPFLGYAEGFCLRLLGQNWTQEKKAKPRALFQEFNLTSDPRGPRPCSHSVCPLSPCGRMASQPAPSQAHRTRHSFFFSSRFSTFFQTQYKEKTLNSKIFRLAAPSKFHKIQIE